ncbi:hypothetical protein L596_000828 [Steinernema carpocapsae]|uniref:Uncharacterized protein n=1 Tax=Steinernema carpocapsae TaxID=34508 RepID=A0A4U8ULK4_STECR|nr:hypothetical protein L596_000828 [Steinernema carpocapsae]
MSTRNIRHHRKCAYDGYPIDRYNFPQLLEQNGIRARSRPIQLYRLICYKVGIDARRAGEVSRAVKQILRQRDEHYVKEGKALKWDSANDRFRILSHMFRIQITIIGKNDLKHHRYFTSGADLFSIMLLESDRDEFQVLEDLHLPQVCQLPHPYCGYVYYHAEEMPGYNVAFPIYYNYPAYYYNTF